MVLIKKIVTDEHYEKIKEEISKKASTYTMGGTKWEMDRENGIQVFQTEPNEEVSLAVTKVKTKSYATFIAGLASDSYNIPKECYNLWIFTISKSGKGYEDIVVTKAYANESLWEGTFSKDTIERCRNDVITKLEKSAEEKDQLKKELLEEKKKTDNLRNENKELEIKLKEVESHLKKYKEMMEGAVNDCKTIVIREESKTKKEKYQRIQEVYEAKIEQLDNAINNWK